MPGTNGSSLARLPGGFATGSVLPILVLGLLSAPSGAGVGSTLPALCLAGSKISDSPVAAPVTSGPVLPPVGPSRSAMERFDRARIEADAGTVEGRANALNLLEEIRGDLWDSPGYHLLLARIYADGRRYDDSRRCYQQILRLQPDNLEARVRSASLLLESVFKRYDRLHVEDATGILDRALRIAADSLQSASPEGEDHATLHAQALYLRALSLCLARRSDGVGRAEFVAKARSGYADTRELVLARPGDCPGLRLHGVNCFDLGLVEEADQVFRKALDRMPLEEKAYFMVPTSLRMDEGFLQLYDREQAQAIQAYWDAQDPTSLDLINEWQLGFWVNTTIAMFYEPQPWRSEFGRAMMLMGPPVSSSSFDFAGLGGKTGLRFGTGISLAFPNGVTLTGFHDQPDLPYHLAPQSHALLRILSRQGPPILEEMPSEEAPPLFVLDASAVDPEFPGRSMLRCLAATPARHGRESWREASLLFRLLDREGRQVAAVSPPLDEDNVQSLGVGAQTGESILLVAHDFRDLPGDRYTLEVALRGPGGEEVARKRSFVHAKSFGGRLRTSGLEAFAEGSPRWKDTVWGGRPYLPTLPLVAKDGRLSFFYMIYGLSPRLGVVEYEPTLIFARLGDLRNDLRLAARGREDEEGIRSGEADDVLSVLTLDDLKYRPIRYQPVRVNVSANPGAPLRATATVDGSAFGAGEYVLIVRIVDRYGPEGRSTAFTTITFRVVEAQEHGSFPR
jgi:tetratricopeptide (TPR) repeat protein